MILTSILVWRFASWILHSCLPFDVWSLVVAAVVVTVLVHMVVMDFKLVKT